MLHPYYLSLLNSLVYIGFAFGEHSPGLKVTTKAFLPADSSQAHTSAVSSVLAMDDG